MIYLHNRGVDYSTPWAESFHLAREFVSKRLHLLHPTHNALLELCQHSTPKSLSLGDMLMIDFKRLRQAGPLDQHQLRNNVTIELEKTQEYLKNIWYTNYINIFVEKTRQTPIHSSLLTSFYNSVTCLASNQVILRFNIKRSFTE